MPICTYFDQYQLDRMKVDDKDIVEILADIEKVGGQKPYIESRIEVRKRWFRKPISTIYYSMYFPTTLPEVQIFNFAHNEDEGSINTFGRRADVLNYLFGYYNGLIKERSR